MVRNIVNKKEIILWLMMASLRENHFKIILKLQLFSSLLTQMFNNFWLPSGMKDYQVSDRRTWSFRLILQVHKWY